MKVALQLTRQFYHRSKTVCNIDIILDSLDQWTLSCLQDPATGAVDPATLLIGESLSPVRDTTITSWDPSSLDWAGWDWNDLSYLFENTE